MGASLPGDIDRGPPQFGASARRNEHPALRAVFMHFHDYRSPILKVLLRSLFSLALAVFLVVNFLRCRQHHGNPSGNFPTAAARKLNMNNRFSSPIAEERVDPRTFRSLAVPMSEDRKESATEYDANFRYNEFSAAASSSFNQPRRKLGMGRRSKVGLFSAIFRDLLDEGLLKTDHKVLCLGRHASEEMVALKERGVTKTIGVQRTQGSKLDQQFADEIFDFEFSAEFDNVPQPALFVSEIERTLKVGGVAAMYVSLATWRERFISSEFRHQIKPVTLLFRHSKIVYVSTAEAPGLDTVIVFKKNPIPRTHGTSARNRHKSDDHAMPDAGAGDVESVLNVEGMKSGSLPNHARPLAHGLRVLADIGVRGLDHCIDSWFDGQSPKITGNELSACIERNGPVQANYALNSQGFSLYAAWTNRSGVIIGKNFWYQHHNRGDEALNIMIVEGVEFIDWLNKTVVDDDFVTINIHGEGTNSELVYRMIETGTIHMIDEVFLDCPHQSSWKDLILRATHQSSYRKCSTFYEMLHNTGVVVHA